MRKRFSEALPVSVKRRIRKLRYFGSLPGETSKRVAYLHLGAHKTGTSSLQHALELNERRLKKKGIAVIQGRDRILGRKAKIQSFETPEFEQKLSGMLDTPAKREITHSVIFSFEGALLTMNWGDGPGPYPAYANCLDLLHRVFSARYDQVKIYYSVRHQAEFYSSLYNQKIYEGNNLDFDTYLTKIVDRNISWLPPIEAMADLFGADNIEITDYSKNRTLPSFSKMIDWSLVPEAEVHKNPSFDARSLDLARLVLPKLKGKAEWQGFRDFLEHSLYHENRERPNLLPQDFVARCDQQYRSDLDALAKMGVALRD